VIVALAAPFNIMLPNVVAPSRKVTVPVGVPAACEVTCAVNVTDCPMREGFNEEVKVVVVPLLLSIVIAPPVTVPKN
jgi:hypothetical protein